MASLTTLDIIVNDLLNIIRGSAVVRTEPISRIQVEVWVHQYRALLIKRELDKKKLINPDYIQDISPLTLTPSGSEYRTIELPNSVFRNHEDGYTWIGSESGKEYQYTTEQRSQWHQYRRYINQEPYVYLLNNRLYTNYPENLRVKGLFENPMEVIRLSSPNAGGNIKYPIPVDMLPALREMILKNELKIEATSPGDDTNNSKHDIQ